MFNWRGDNNPGHKRRLALQQAIETEFQEPLADVIIGLRQQDGGNSWRTVAGCLGVSLSTLQLWRKELGLEINARKQVFDPSSGKSPHHLDFRAQALGYKSARDAVIDLRLVQKLTLEEAAARLGCHPQTVSIHTPAELSGLYNRSDYWWTQRRQWAADMLERQKKLRGVVEDHWFQKDNAVIFQNSP